MAQNCPKRDNRSVDGEMGSQRQSLVALPAMVRNLVFVGPKIIPIILYKMPLW